VGFGIGTGGLEGGGGILVGFEKDDDDDDVAAAVGVAAAAAIVDDMSETIETTLSLEVGLVCLSRGVKDGEVDDCSVDDADEEKEKEVNSSARGSSEGSDVVGLRR